MKDRATDVAPFFMKISKLHAEFQVADRPPPVSLDSAFLPRV